MNKKIPLFTSLFLLTSLLFSFCIADESPLPPATERTMVGGWYEWDPYQYLAIPSDPKSLTGLDYELEKAIMERAGYKTEISPVSWKQHNEDLESGKRDFAMGAFSSQRRQTYNYLTHPYRFEEDAVYVLKEHKAHHTYESIPEFLQTIKKHNLVIGVVAGYRYANDTFNDFVADPANSKYIHKSDADKDNIRLLLDKKLDGLICDKIVGTTNFWREKKGKLITEIPLKDAKAPIHMLLSKKTVTNQEYERINKVIDEFVNSSEYKKIVTWYLYPLVLQEILDSPWFYLIELIGMASFAISGAIIAYRVNASLLGTFILALIPSFGGGIFRDVIFGRFPIGFTQATTPILLVLTISIFSFFCVKMFAYLKRKTSPETLERLSISVRKQNKIADAVLVTTDAMGLAAFTISGVFICMLTKVSPLWLWGPFFAFLTGAGGGFIRDVIVRDLNVTKQPLQAINGSLYGENCYCLGMGPSPCFCILHPTTLTLNTSKSWSYSQPFSAS